VTVLGRVAEMERRFNRERQQTGIEAAKAKGVYKGRKPSVPFEKVREMYALAMTGASVRPKRSAAAGAGQHGSVRARASQYRLTWNEANPGSCGLQDGQHRHTPPKEEQSPAVGGHVLMGAGARAEKVAQFIVGSTEPSR
jgi:hypothetical protein